jgi:hypothetical protein
MARWKKQNWKKYVGYTPREPKSSALHDNYRVRNGFPKANTISSTGQTGRGRLSFIISGE